MDKLPFSPWFLFFAVLVIFAIIAVSWQEMRRADRIAVRRRKMRQALETFRIARNYERGDGSSELFLYSAENSKRLLELENHIIKYGNGSASWLFFMPERRLFFILELVAIEPDGDLHFITTLHPIKPDRARQVLARYPELYREIFREEI
ncbi:protein BatD [Chitinimonas sp. BJB300]|uniref:protein BatD n=1 Tax=Chitinimonas sp. BJB300 TaxID=1559339 RepID=UPI001111FDFD|nr:protein BatD [Chitinimonas sp. BJB300]TSJ88919.1 protein BatD [Chitinimonas sp. BJB300]